MTVDELRTALQGGKSLAAVAKEKGIDVAKVVDALVAELKTHLDEHVASGKNTQAEADQMLADARTRIEAFVNGTAPAGGPGFGGFGGPGGRGHRGPGGGGPGAPRPLQQLQPPAPPRPNRPGQAGVLLQAPNGGQQRAVPSAGGGPLGAPVARADDGAGLEP